MLKTGQVSKKQSTPVKTDAVTDLKLKNYTANFRIEHQSDVPNRFVSLNKAAMADAKKGQEKLTDAEIAEKAAFAKDVRSSHFNFGTDNVSYTTANQEGLVAHQVTIDSVTKGNNNRKDQIDNMRKANFKIGVQANPQPASSCYKKMISDVADADGFANGRA